MALISHKETIHKENKTKKAISKRIQCDKCDKKFNKKETFNEHHRLVHNTKCDKCNKECTTNIIVKDHMKKIHKETNVGLATKTRNKNPQKKNEVHIGASE